MPAYSGGKGCGRGRHVWVHSPSRPYERCSRCGTSKLDNSQEGRTRRAEYKRRWYARHGERHRARMREYMRRRNGSPPERWRV